MEHGTLCPDGYLPRLVDRVLSDRLKQVGAVEVAGTMWCGKTWTSMAHGNSISRIASTSVRLAAESDPTIALIGEKPHVIDEWQDVPAIWDEVRMHIDETGGKPGQFILTGSSQPHKERIHHSGAGRISRLCMRTMSLQESGKSSGKVSLSGLFKKVFEPQLVQQSLIPLAEFICQGGWPSLVHNEIDDSTMLINSYFDALFDINVPRKGLDGSDSRNIAVALARNLGSAPRLYTLAADARFDKPEGKSAANKAASHVAVLKDLYVLEEICGWDAPIRSPNRLRTKPKYYFADPSLAAGLLNVRPERLLQDGQLFGVLFESLCIHDLCVYASVLPDAKPVPVSYYRDADGLETDAVIELRDGRWAAFEIKLGENKADEGIASLIRLQKKIALNPAAENPEPEFMAVLVGAGEYARRDKETGIYVIPITVLGA
ncbi:MAG: DUF4143 domain-containing protein [Clostridiales bacterium]|nr:DUF4143 domain-containing protein [Clostridiales bacterium]